MRSPPPSFRVKWSVLGPERNLFIRSTGTDPAAARRSLEKIAQETHQTFNTASDGHFGPGYHGIDISLLGAQRPAEIELPLDGNDTGRSGRWSGALGRWWLSF